MDDAAPTVLRCEDCGAVRPDDGPGWLRVAYPVSNRHAAGAEVFLYY